MPVKVFQPTVHLLCLNVTSNKPNCYSSSSIMDPREFEWESQLRFYWLQEHDDLFVHQCSASFSYGYEYMGLNGRLVITPLTDRIYLTITQVSELLQLFLFPQTKAKPQAIK